MRQIHLCAWLMVTSLAAPACGGEQFTSNERSAGNSSADGGNNPPPEDDDDSASGGAGSAIELGGRASGGGSATTAGAASGGSATSAGMDPGGGAAASCATGSVKLRMLASPELPPDYLCDAGCGTGWLTITDALGAAAFSLFPACGSVSCDSCSLLPCAAAACLPTPLTADGSALEWTGTFLAKDACGGNKMACQRPECVPPGRYKARACAAINAGANDAAVGSCTPKNEQLCAEAEFDFPATNEVELVLKK